MNFLDDGAVAWQSHPAALTGELGDINSNYVYRRAHREKRAYIGARSRGPADAGSRRRRHGATLGTVSTSGAAQCIKSSRRPVAGMVTLRVCSLPP